MGGALPEVPARVHMRIMRAGRAQALAPRRALVPSAWVLVGVARSPGWNCGPASPPPVYLRTIVGTLATEGRRSGPPRFVRSPLGTRERLPKA